MGRLQIDTTREFCRQAALYAQIFYRVPQEIVRYEWIPNIKLQDLLNRKKLCLVLDLDHTLLHTKLEQKLSGKEILCSDDICRWDSNGVKYLTKLRPFVRKFLQEASELFDLYIYTKGSRYYAKRMARLLDPDRVYFGSRIVSREDSTVKGQKGLDVVPVHKSGVVILDDTENVWARDLSNLVLIKQYNYFTSEANTITLLDEVTDESETSGSLNCALRLLQKVHKLYFEFNHMFDVSEILGNLMKNIGIQEEKQQERYMTGNSRCDMISRKRLRVNDECLFRDVTKRQRC